MEVPRFKQRREQYNFLSPGLILWGGLSWISLSKSQLESSLSYVIPYAISRHSRSYKYYSGTIKTAHFDKQQSWREATAYNNQ
jgi:hypothetical protein